MSYLYVNEQGAKIGFENNRFVVKCKEEIIRTVPIETVDEISVFGAVQVTTQCLQECLKRGINIIFYSINGSYFGRLISSSHVNVERQRMQAALYEDEQFKLGFSKRIIEAKIKNQIVIIRRYTRNAHQEVDTKDAVRQMQYMIKKAGASNSIEQLMGYEGTAAKIYFQALGELVDPAFHFTGRTRRPPLDPFNSMISLGYSILMNEIYGKLESKGLNPYFGIMHKDREKHPTLASDMMEEWRATLVDATVMSLVNGHEVRSDEFFSEEGREGIFLQKSAYVTFVRKLESKFRTENKYLSDISYAVTFRRAIDLQILNLIRAIEAREPELYNPIIIR